MLQWLQSRILSIIFIALLIYFAVIAPVLLWRLKGFTNLFWWDVFLFFELLGAYRYLFVVKEPRSIWDRSLGLWQLTAFAVLIVGHFVQPVLNSLL